jgi:hypothetical protein
MQDYFKVLSHDLKNKSDLIRDYFKIHSGENGRNKEDLLINFLKSYLPNRYSLSTGFIFDTNDVKSNQNDIIIYDSFWSSILFPENVSQFFPIESVYGLIEVKSMLDTNALKETIKKAKTIKTMPIKGVTRNLGFNGIKEPFYSIFAYESVSMEALKQTLATEYANTPLKERIDFIVILNKGLFYTGNYFEIVKYGMPNSQYRISLGQEGVEHIKNEYPSEIESWELNENSLFVWYTYLMSYLSYSADKISTMIDYLPPNETWGRKL